ncbi:MAG: LysR family transcriptional regulator [Stenotrophomonas sp.]|uniref:LysR family transcriptional regulator n=1 Tax=Stenotrophomonas sp. TaxID=69392 RepID=UPI003D6CF751
MNQLIAIRAFARVVEAGSFTRAADSLDMPNATLSKLVRELEAHLGVRLLQRTTRRVSITAEGQAYYEKAGRILRDLEDIDASFSAARGTPRGLLRVDVGGSTARDVLVPALPDFMHRYPDIRIELGVSDRTVNLVGENVDCVIRGGPLDDSSLVARHLGDAVLITCASPAYLKACGLPAYPQELHNGHRLVSYLLPSTGRAVPFRFRSAEGLLEIKPEHRLGINESNAHLAAALAGMGLVQTFSYAAGPALRSGALVEVLQPWRPAPYPFHVVYPNNRHVTHRLRVFIDWLAERMPGLLADGGAEAPSPRVPPAVPY